MKCKFTQGKVATLAHRPAEPKRGKQPKQYTLHWDSGQPGLGVRVTANGARSYVFESRVHGRTVRTTIGNTQKWQLAKAQAEARRLASECVDRGVDPRVVAKQERAQADADRIESQRHAHVLSGVWAAYIEDCKAGWGARHLKDHTEVAHPGGERKKVRSKGEEKPGLTKPGPLAPLMPLKLSELTADTVALWLKREAAKRPTSAAKAYRLLRAFVGWAADSVEYKGIIPADALTARDVRRSVPKSKTKSDCLQKEQLPAWFAAVRALPNPYISAFLQGLLLTGPRREELAALEWTDVDFTWNSLRLGDKVEDERIIPLTPYLASLLSKLPRKNKWVFYSATADGGRLTEPTKAHNHALEVAGLPHITLHGLRRSFSTLSEWVEMPTGVVAQIQGHKPSATAEKHYKVRPLDLLRKWHTTLEAWILEQGGIKFAPVPAGKLGVVKADGSVRASA
jgi:integrase